MSPSHHRRLDDATLLLLAEGLLPPEEAEACRREVAADPELAGRYAALERSVAVLRRLPAREPPERVWHALAAYYDRREAARRRRRWLRPALAAAAALLLLVGIWRAALVSTGPRIVFIPGSRPAATAGPAAVVADFLTRRLQRLEGVRLEWEEADR